MLLGWLAKKQQRAKCASAQRLIEAAVDALIENPATRTPDLGGPLGTRAFTAALCDRIQRIIERA